MKKSILMMALAFAALAALPACKLSAGGYYAGSGIYDSGSSWGSSNDSWHDHDDNWGSSGGSSSREEAERDAYDRQEHSGGGGLTPPDRKIDPNMMIMTRGSAVKAQSPFRSTDSRVIQVAQKYDITHYAATYIVRAVELAKIDDASGIADLGLEKKDFQKMIKGKLSDEKLAAVGSKLLMTTEDVERLMIEMKTDIKNANEKN